MPEGILNQSTITASKSPPAKWLYLLHGIYGTGRNWGSLARRLVDDRTEWGVVLVDLRLHGGSMDFEPPHTVQACAEDVLRLEEALGRPATAILGHSFGGKVALLRGGRLDPPAPQIWVADSTLRTGDPSGTAWRVIEVIRGLPNRFESREQLVEGMVAAGYDRGVGQWLGMNLEREGEQFTWKLDWDAIEQMLRDYFHTDVWPVIEKPPTGTELHLIRALRSDSIDEGSAEKIRSAGRQTGRVHLHEVQAGHWLNVDNPEAVLDLLETHLPA